MLNLDTHILLHMFAGSLTRNEQKLLTHERLGVSAIVFWETRLSRATRDERPEDTRVASRSTGGVALRSGRIATRPPAEATVFLQRRAVSDLDSLRASPRLICARRRPDSRLAAAFARAASLI